MFNPSDDPLGIAVQQRARDARWRQMLQGHSSPIGPLADPQWEGYFQALEESADGKPVKLVQDRPFGDFSQSLGIGGSRDKYDASPAGDYGDVRQFDSAITPSEQIGSGAPGSYVDRRRAASMAALQRGR